MNEIQNLLTHELLNENGLTYLFLTFSKNTFIIGYRMRKILVCWREKYKIWIVYKIKQREDDVLTFIENAEFLGILISFKERVIQDQKNDLENYHNYQGSITL